MFFKRRQWFETGIVIAFMYAAAEAMAVDTQETHYRETGEDDMSELTPSKVRRVEAKVR